MAKPPHTGGEMGGLYLICWRRNYPQATGTRPRDAARSDSESAFRQAGFSALNAATQGTLATMFLVSGLPYAAIGTGISAAIAGVSVWQGIQALGKGVQSASQSSSADTILQVLYPPEPPGTLVHDAEPAGPLKQVPQSLGQK